MVNSCNSRSPILLDTPERPTGTWGNTTVIEIPDSNERSHPRRRRLESVDGVIIADNSKRARVDVPVIDLTTDNEDESSSVDNNADSQSFLRTLESSPYYAEIMRGRFLSDHNRLRIRRAMSLRHRQSSHHASHPVEERHNGSVTSRGDTARYNHFLNNLRVDNSEPTILVDDDDSSGQPGVAGEFSRPSCSRISPPRLTTDTDNIRPHFLPRSEWSRLSTHSNLHSQESHEGHNERRRDASHQIRAVRRNQRRLREQTRQLRERLEHISSPFTSFSDAAENFDRSVQNGAPERQETGVHSSVYTRPNPTIETNPVRMNLRTSPPLERELRPYDIPDLMLPALLSWWGPDSRLRHFGDGDEEREDYEALWSLTERLGQVKPKGLSKGEMEVIPAFRYSAASKDSSNGSCVVCMMNYSNKEKLRRLPCNHDFHAKCIDRWLKNNRSCPVCRKDVTTK